MKKFLSVLMAMTFLFIAGCSTTSTEHGTKNPSLQIDSSKTTQPSISSNNTSTSQVSDPKIENNNTVDDKKTGVPPRTSSFKSVEEMLDWIQNDEFADCTFKQTVKELNLDHILTIESSDNTFSLNEIDIMHKTKGVRYHFTNEDNKEIYYSVLLPTENQAENYLETVIMNTNKIYKELYKTPPHIHVGEEVTILDKTRKTYTRDYCAQVKEKETGEITPIYAMFVTDIDGFKIEGSLRGSLLRQNWDNKYLNYFEFSMQSINK